jgi:hypothetical protein
MPISQKSRDYFARNLVIFLSILLGQILLLVIITFITDSRGYYNSIRNINGSFLIGVTGFIGLSGALTGDLIFRKRNALLLKKDSLSEKLVGYRNSLVIKYSLLGIPSILSIVLFSLTGNKLFAVFAIVITFYLSRIKPSKERLINDLDLSEDEQVKINDSDAIVVE